MAHKPCGRLRPRARGVRGVSSSSSMQRRGRSPLVGNAANGAAKAVARKAASRSDSAASQAQAGAAHWGNLAKGAACFALGAGLLASSSKPWLLWPVGIVLEGLALVWLQLVERDAEQDSFFASKVLNLWIARFIQWKVHMALGAVLATSGVWGLVLLLKFWLLPLIIVQITFSVLSSPDTAGEEEEAEEGDAVAREVITPPGRDPPGRRSRLVDVTRGVVAEVLGVQPSCVGMDSALMDLGLDSPMALRLRDKLSRTLKVELPSSFLFNHPTVNAMVDGLGRHQSWRPQGTANPATGQALVVTSAACELPGSADLEALWAALTSRVDSVVEVPLGRWDHSKYYAAEPQDGKTYARHGGFIEGAHLFDAAAFGMSAAETRAADPQQRLLLSTAYASLWASGYDRAMVQGSQLGVFMALSNLDWYRMSLPAAGAYTGTGTALAVGANRLSYVFGLKGPSMAVDTACSSSLAALAAATAGFTSQALVGGADLLHGPCALALRSSAGMLSDRCKTFNATADGYVRGEGSLERCELETNEHTAASTFFNASLLTVCLLCTTVHITGLLLMTLLGVGGRSTGS
uniref:Type I polyketide synthase n=1 Tax=Gambierdiscus polynesiensis TaxID=439318 RepID=A0A1S6K8G0_9DINO|nr:type I polyketide synthase [Gambierdiscus polynesiensis]